MIKTYNKHNFHSHTFCIWNEVSVEEIKGLKISYTSQSGSRYIFTEVALYRISNHWGRVANCHWRLVPLFEFKNQNTTVAFAKWTDFYSNDDLSKLFYIQVDFENKEVNFYHKESLDNNYNVILRNAKDTAKIIRKVKEVMTETDWAKYLDYKDIEELRKEIVTDMIQSSKTFIEIKMEYSKRLRF